MIYLHAMKAFRAATKHYNIPIFIPQLGCPFQCAFCNQHQIASVNNLPNPNEIISTIENYLNTIPQGSGNIQVAFFGGSFTGLPMALQKEYLASVQDYIDSGKINSIRLSTRPDFINREILDMLMHYRVQTIELGAQSLDDEVLRLTGRGHTAQDVLDASALIRSYGFSLGLQMMIGLPGDTKEKSMATAKKIVDAGADHTRIYPALVIKDTRLERWFRNKKFVPLSLDESLDWSVDLLEIFEKAGVKVIRIGLHPSDGLINGESLVAGPFHVSYRELVMSRVWRKRLEKELIMEGENIDIYVAPDQMNYAIGHNSQNRNWLLKHFKKVRFHGSQQLTKSLVHSSTTLYL
jgi:histone acetyltransferase (RNA polymerase elongator complex component)